MVKTFAFDVILLLITHLHGFLLPSFVIKHKVSFQNPHCYMELATWKRPLTNFNYLHQIHEQLERIYAYQDSFDSGCLIMYQLWQDMLFNATSFFSDLQDLVHWKQCLDTYSIQSEKRKNVLRLLSYFLCNHLFPVWIKWRQILRAFRAKKKYQ